MKTRSRLLWGILGAGWLIGPGSYAEDPAPRRVFKKPSLIVGTCVSPASYLTHADQTPPVQPNAAMARPGVKLTLKPPYVTANSRGELRYRLSTDELIAVEAVDLPSATAAFERLPSGAGWQNQPTTVTSKDIDGDGVEECIVVKPGDGEKDGEVVVVQWRNGRWRRRVQDAVQGWNTQGPHMAEVVEGHQLMWVTTSVGVSNAPETAWWYWYTDRNSVSHGRLTAYAWKDPVLKSVKPGTSRWVLEGTDRFKVSPFQFEVPHFYVWEAKGEKWKDGNRYFKSQFVEAVFPELERLFAEGVKTLDAETDPALRAVKKSDAHKARKFIDDLKRQTGVKP